LNERKHNKGLRGARAALVIAVSCGAADARESRTTLAVSATVVPVARIERQSIPADVLITPRDLQRGYVDVEAPVALVIRSNSPGGYALDLDSVSPLFSSLVVRGLASEQSLGADGGTIVQRWQNAHVATLSLQFRFVLAPGLHAGHHAWPIELRVRPLEDL
jgi:hypothetical protein